MNRLRWRDVPGVGHGQREACEVCGYHDDLPASASAAVNWRTRVTLIPPAHRLCDTCAAAAAALLPTGEVLEINRCACRAFGLVAIADRHACARCVTTAIDTLTLV